jgi:hypothetical protein
MDPGRRPSAARRFVALALCLLPALALADAPRPGAPQGAQPAAPDWSKEELRGIFTRAQVAATAPSVDAQDDALADLAGFAYRVTPQPGEQREAFARRVLAKRRPEHPRVQKGQWLAAALGQLYEDVAERAKVLARFEIDRRERQYLEESARQAAAAASELRGALQIVVEGLDGAFEPLPVVDGDEPRPLGAMAMVKDQAIVIENLERLRFVDGRPPESAARTPTGALRELFAAMAQYNQHAQLLGTYDAVAKKGHGHLRAVLPAASSALLLNELVRAGLQAKMHTVHLMTMSPGGILREVTFSLVKASGKAKAGAAAEAVVSCDDGLTMQLCAERIAHRRGARVRFVVE